MDLAETFRALHHAVNAVLAKRSLPVSGQYHAESSFFGRTMTY